MTRWAPSSAAILHDRARYLASLFISLPTAVTANTGIPYLSPSSTALARFSKVCFSYSPPTNIDTATADALSLMASSMEVVISSFESSLSMLVPPEILRTIGIDMFGSTEVLRIPLVSISESAYSIRGSIVALAFSNPVVGPWK